MGNNATSYSWGFSSNIVSDTGHLEVVNGFPLSIQANSGMCLKIGYIGTSVSFHVLNSSFTVVVPFDSV
jgi:hypothetical protein